MKDLKLHISFLFLLIAMLVGLLLRLQFVFPIENINFKNFLHAHSHVAMLGWGFNSLFLAIIYTFIKDKKEQNKIKIPFWVAQISIFGALISFPIQGYKTFSIVFSTTFLFASYWLTYLFFKLSKQKKSIAYKFIKWSLIYLTLSSLGPLSLGVFVANGLKETIWYPLSIYYYLHFFYNGFMILAIFGIVIKQFEKLKIEVNKSDLKKVFFLINVSIIPTFALSTLWIEGHYILNIVGIIGSFLQIIAGFYFWKISLKIKNEYFQNKHPLLRKLFTLVLIFFSLKIIIQFFSGFDTIAAIGYSVKSYLIIGYIHLVMLGVISLFSISYFVYVNKFSLVNKASITGVIIFIAGLVLSEILLFSQGGLIVLGYKSIPEFNLILLLSSSFMPIGLIIFYIYNLINKTSEN